jgi:hypothetical protein
MQIQMLMSSDWTYLTTHFDEFRVRLAQMLRSMIQVNRGFGLI